MSPADERRFRGLFFLELTSAVYFFYLRNSRYLRQIPPAVWPRFRRLFVI